MYDEEQLELRMKRLLARKSRKFHRLAEDFLTRYATEGFEEEVDSEDDEYVPAAHRPFGAGFSA